MWALDNMTPYAAERTCVLDKNGARRWVVVVKATFDIESDGSTKLADEQVPPVLVPEFLGKDGESSLKYDTELTNDKPGTDVVLHGTAHAPGGRPVSKLDVELRVNAQRKVLRVFGDRLWERELSGEVVPGPTKPFVTMPIVYERAYGGYDKSNPDPAKQKLFGPNPVGVGVVLDRSKLIGTPAPNIEHPTVTGRAERAAGFGPIACHWQPRVRYAGTYDGKWFKERKPLLPDDFDPRYHMCAPEDQQFIPHLRDVEIELTNLTPSGRLLFRLPKIYLTFETHFSRGEPAQHRAKLHTVTIEADKPRVMLAYHTSLACHHRYDDIDDTLIRELPYLDLRSVS